MLCSPYNCLKLSCVASLDLRNRWSRFLVDDVQEEQREETNWSISSRSGKILVASGSYKPENERETKWMNLQKHTHIWTPRSWPGRPAYQQQEEIDPNLGWGINGGDPRSLLLSFFFFENHWSFHYSIIEPLPIRIKKITEHWWWAMPLLHQRATRYKFCTLMCYSITWSTFKQQDKLHKAPAPVPYIRQDWWDHRTMAVPQLPRTRK